MIPDIYKSIMSIFEHYRENSTDMFPGQIADMIETKTLPKLFELTNNLLTNIVPMLYEASMSFAKGLFNLFIAFIVSIYMTIDKFILKNAGKRLVLAIFNENFSYRVLRTLKDCHNIFSGFIIGKSIDSLIFCMVFPLFLFCDISYDPVPCISGQDSQDNSSKHICRIMHI